MVETSPTGGATPDPIADQYSYDLGYNDGLPGGGAYDKAIIVDRHTACQNTWEAELMFADDPILRPPGGIPTSWEDYIRGCYDALYENGF
jgi:hypothetical protein